MATTTSSLIPSTTTASNSPSCTTAVPDKYGHVPFEACNSYYNFDPNFEAAVAVAVLFGLLTAIHIAEAIIYKKRYAWVLIMGATWETISFTLHALGAHRQQSTALAMGHTLLYLLAPLWVNAFAYMTLARAAHLLSPRRRAGPFKSTVLSKVFVWADVATFLVQGAGGSVASGPDVESNTLKWGLRVYMIGMGLQEGAILCFVGLMVAFQREMRAVDVVAVAGRTAMGWKGMLYALYAVLAAITVRIIYRIAEFAGGVTPSNPIPFHEAYSYALDAFPMLAALVILAVWHPGRVLQGPNSDFTLVRAERKAAKKAAKAEKRAAKEAAKEDKRERKEERRRVRDAKRNGGYEDIELGTQFSD